MVDFLMGGIAAAVSVRTTDKSIPKHQLTMGTENRRCSYRASQASHSKPGMSMSRPPQDLPHPPYPLCLLRGSDHMHSIVLMVNMAMQKLGRARTIDGSNINVGAWPSSFVLLRATSRTWRRSANQYACDPASTIVALRDTSHHG